MSLSCFAGSDFDEVQAVLARHIQPLGTETVPLAKAGRRYLAEPVLARIDGPRCAVAAMDGFAVRASDVIAGRTQFAVIGVSFPSAPCEQIVESVHAARVTTGAPIPAGADQVVMTEHTAIEGYGIRLTSPIPSKRHVRAQASDFATGDIIVPAGRVIDHRTLVAAAAADVDSLTVRRRPKVVVLTSGDELEKPGCGSALMHGLPDSLSEAILLLCREWGPNLSVRPG